MNRAGRLLVTLLGLLALAGPAATGAVAVPRSSAPSTAVATTGPAASVPEATVTTAPRPGRHRVGPADGLRPGTGGSVVRAANAIDLASRSGSRNDAVPAGPATYAISGAVRDDSSEAIGGIDVVVCAGDCASATYTELTSTQDDGSWSVSVPAGWYTVEFVDSYYFMYATGFYAQSGFTYNSLAASHVLVNAPVALPSVTMPGLQLVSGRVRNSGSTNLAGIRVEGWVAGTYYNDATTSSDGTYSLLMPPGKATLFLFDPAGKYAGGWWTNPGVSYFAAMARTVSVAAADIANINATLPTAVHIAGKVVSPTGAGLPNVFVEAYCNGEEAAWATTKTDGTYSIGTVPGSFTLVFYEGTGAYGSGWRGSPGFTNDEAKAGLVTVGSAGLTGVNVTLPLARRIGGKVTDASAATLRNVEVDLYVNGSFFDYARTGTSGTYSMAVPPGSYQVAFFDETWTHASGWWSSAGFKYWWASAGTVNVSTASATAVNAALPASSSPGAPTGVGAAGYNQSATVWWTHPANNGGLDALTYTVTANPGGRTCSSASATSCTVGGLTNGQAYAFTVTARNILGTGPASTGTAATPAAVPDAPKNVTAVGLDASVSVSWTAPANNGSPITGYKVQAWGDGSRACTTTTALTCKIGGLANRTAYSVTVIATNGVGAGPAGVANGDVAPRAGNSFVPLIPSRVLDTKTHKGLAAALTPYKAATFAVTNRAPGDATRNVPSGAIAVTGVLSVSSSTALGYLALTPKPIDRPTTSTLNFPKGDARATGVTVPLSTTGTLSVTYAATTGTAQAAFDVTGYFLAGTSGSTYVALTPNRILDSRAAYKNGMTSGLTAGTHKSFTVVGRTPTDATSNVPSNAVAVTGTLTVTSQSAAGYLSLGPEALDKPTTASLYFPKGDNRATGLTVKLGTGGKLNVTFTSSTAGAKTDVVFDVNGYFLAGGSGAMYVPLTPNRILDTRKAKPLGQFKAIHPYTAATFAVTGRVPTDVTQNVPTAAVAVTGILTVTSQTALGYLALTKTPINKPTTSSLNFPRGDNRATGVTVPLGTGGKLSVTYGASPSSMTTHVIFDVSGYFVK